MLPIDADLARTIHQDRLKEAEQERLLKLVKAHRAAQRSSRPGLARIAMATFGLKTHLAHLSSALAAIVFK